MSIFLKSITCATLVLLCSVSTAQNLTAVVGQSNQIQAKLENQKSEQCNIEVTFPNGTKVEVVTTKPDYIAKIDFSPEVEGSNSISWQGKVRFRGLKSLVGCEGSGKITVIANPSNETKINRWSELAGKISDKQKACIAAGIKVVNGNVDFNALSGEISHDINEPIVKTIRGRCESFADNLLQKKQACNIENRKTFCDEMYEITINGEKKQFAEDQLLAYLFRREQIQKITFENSEAFAQYEAYKKTPAYKKEQAELAKKQAADDALAKKNAIEAEKQRAKEEAEAKKQKEIEAKRLADLKTKEDAVPYRLLFLCMDANGYGNDVQYAQGLVTYFIPDPGLNMNLRIRDGLGVTKGNCQPTNGDMAPSQVDVQSLKLIREKNDIKYYIFKSSKTLTYGIARP